MSNTMIAGELVPIWFFPNPQPPVPPPPAAQLISLVDAEAVMMKIQSPATGVTRSVAMIAVIPDANPVDHYATYTTLATDFPTTGCYLLQFSINFLSGIAIESPVQKLVVRQSL